MPPAPDIEGLILAGGESRRMGTPKSFLPYRGGTLIDHVIAQLSPAVVRLRVSANDPRAFAHLGLAIVPDLRPGEGPLMGIASALTTAEFPWTLVVATDIPELPIDLLDEMRKAAAGHSCVVLRDESGQLQPHFGLYHRNLAETVLDFLASGRRRMVDFALCAGAVAVPVPAARLRNLNDQTAYRAALDTGEIGQ